MFMRIRFCKSMNQADPRAGRRKRGDAAELRIRVLVSFLVACVCAITASSQTSDDLALGLSEFSKGNFSSAAALFARAEEAAQGTTDALLYESKAYIHLEKFTAAEGALRRYLLVHAASGDALYLLGYVLHREGKATESLETYTKAAQHRIPAGDDLKIVGLNYVLLNDYSDAIKWLEKAVEAEPKNKEAWYFLGRAYYTKSRVPEARKAFLTVLELDPRDAKAENNLGLILESEAQPAAAMDAYRRAIQWQEQSVRPREQPFLNLGSLLMEQSRVGDAVPLLQKAVQLAPENPAAHYQLGKLYKAMTALDRAKAEFDRTAELHSRAASSKPQ